MEALSAEIKALLTGPMKGKRTGVGELRKKMEAQSDAQVSALKILNAELQLASDRWCRCRLHMKNDLTFSSDLLGITGDEAGVWRVVAHTSKKTRTHRQILANAKRSKPASSKACITRPCVEPRYLIWFRRVPGN